MTDRAAEETWPGRKFGLPRNGPGAVGGWVRRVLALMLDWALSLLFVGAFVGSGVWTGSGISQWGPLLVFGVQRWLFVTLLGGSAAQIVVGLRVVRTGGGGLDPLRALVRAALVCLVIPAVIFNLDRQGLHDIAADSIVVRS